MRATNSADNRRQPQTTQQPEPLTEHRGSQSAAPATKSAHGGSQSAAPATNSAHGGSQSAVPATKSAHGGSQSAVPATKSTHGGSQSAVPATKSAHGGSQSASPATNSARQETSAYSNHNGGTDQRSMEVYKVLRLPRILRMEVHKLLRLPRILHMEVHKVLRLPRLLHAMEGRTGDHRRQPQTTADNATARASSGAWRFTECCACHEFCTWRFTKCFACHDFCTQWRDGPATTADNRRQPPTAQQPEPLAEHGGSQSAVPATNSGDVSVCVVAKCFACHEICA